MLEDAAGIGLKLLGGVDAAGDGAAGVYLGFHSLRSLNQPMLLDLPYRVSLLRPAVTLVPSGLVSGWWCAVHTFLNVRTAEMLRVLGFVILASFFRQAMRLRPNIHTCWVTTIAGSTRPAVDDSLRRKSNVRPCPVSGNVDSVSDGT